MHGCSAAAPFSPTTTNIPVTRNLCPPTPTPGSAAASQAKQGFGLVEGHASVEDLVEEADGFAEVFPEHKFMIVKILQVGGCLGWCGVRAG